jgi:hypothetical protein
MVKKVTSDCTGGSLISREEQKVMAQIEMTATLVPRFKGLR